MDLLNAELALRRARSDLATRVRTAYYALLVAKETVRVNKSLARYTDEIYRLHTGLLGAGTVASYEPMALRALAYTARLSYQQAIPTYIYAWKQLVAAIGLRQLPLTEVAGRIDLFIPYFDYDNVLAYALRNHTDVLTARNGLDKARYVLKSAQITPFPDVDVNVSLLKEYALLPKQFVHTVTIGLPFPIWDRNKGNIISAEAALMRAGEEPHRVEESLTTTLATAYTGYKTNLDALEYYRRYILPDQVRAYRGVLARRQIDPSVAFADLLGAQQTLVADVTAYLGILGSLWSSAVSVADLLQTDDLFQIGQPRAIPALPDLESLLPWPCCHDCPPPGTDPKGACGYCPSAPMSAAGQPALPGEGLPAPRHAGALPQTDQNPETARPLPPGDVPRQDKATVPADDKPLTLPP
jgi:cobalt-zinc-cadmium efflux system outer membrane protein